MDTVRSRVINHGEQGRATVEQPRHGGRHGDTRRPRGRALGGSIAAGLVLLTLVLVGAQLYSSYAGYGGPGVAVVAGHGIAAAVAITLQVIADRRADRLGALAAVGVYVVLLAVVWLWWF